MELRRSRQGEEPRSLLVRKRGRKSEKFQRWNLTYRPCLSERTLKMAQRRGRATSRFAGGTQTHRATSATWLWICLLLPSAAEAGLYSFSDQIILLNPENVKSVLVNSSAAIVAEFYASWCGHCVHFSPVYKSLARDIKGWFGALPRHQLQVWELVLHNRCLSAEF